MICSTESSVIVFKRPKFEVRDDEFLGYLENCSNDKQPDNLFRNRTDALIADYVAKSDRNNLINRIFNRASGEGLVGKAVDLKGMAKLREITREEFATDFVAYALQSGVFENFKGSEELADEVRKKMNVKSVEGSVETYVEVAVSLVVASIAAVATMVFSVVAVVLAEQDPSMGQLTKTANTSRTNSVLLITPTEVKIVAELAMQAISEKLEQIAA